MPIDPYATASGLLDQSAQGLERFQGGLLGNINDYIDPYYQQVMGDTIGRMQDDTTRSLGGVGDQAIAAGAFGGGRHGLVESDLMSQSNRNIGEMANRLSSQAFNQAGNLYGQDVSTQLGIGGAQAGLGNQYLGIGNQIQQQQAGYGQQQQALMQQILSGQSGAWQNMQNSPYQIIDMFSALMGNDPRRGAGMQTQATTPGLFDYLSLGMQMGGGLMG